MLYLATAGMAIVCPGWIQSLRENRDEGMEAAHGTATGTAAGATRAPP